MPCTDVTRNRGRPSMARERQPREKLAEASVDVTHNAAM